MGQLILRRRSPMSRRRQNIAGFAYADAAAVVRLAGRRVVA